MKPETGKTVSLLVIEDDDVDIMGVKRAMQRQRIANPIVVAHDGIEALELLRAPEESALIQRPFMILLDLNMPRMGGLEFLEEIRADPSLHDSVIFVMTTSDSDQDRLAAYSQHIAGYILKTSLTGAFESMVELLGAYWRIVELP